MVCSTSPTAGESGEDPSAPVLFSPEPEPQPKMHGGKRRGLLAVVLVLAAVVAVPATVVGTATGDEVGQQSAEATASGDRDAPSNASRAVASTPAQSDVIVVEQEYRLTPGEKGQVDVRWKFTVPENVIQISTQLPDDATDPRRNGFRKTTDGYVWEESEQSTRTPTLTYTAAVNQTDEVSGPIGTEGEYLFADTGEWALIQRQPGPGLSFRYRGDQPPIERTNTTAGAGVAGESMIFLGSHETYERSAYDQQFRLIVPEAATLTPSRDDVFETVTDASASLRVGDRDQQVLMFVAPASVPWAVRGLQVGDRDFYAVADESVNAAGNVWIHEYVHTRQDFERGDAIRWFVEASAQYYAGLLTLEQGRIDFDAFRDALSRGTERRFEDVVLADPATWEGTGGNYYTGVLVAGELDRQIRIATDRQGTLQGVLGRMNGQPSPVSQADFLGSVERVGGTTPADLARRYTERTDRPDGWSQREHGDAFEPLPASFIYALPPAGSDDRRVRGLYRNRTLASEPLVTVVLGIALLLLPLNPLGTEQADERRPVLPPPPDLLAAEPSLLRFLFD